MTWASSGEGSVFWGGNNCPHLRSCLLRSARLRRGDFTGGGIVSVCFSVGLCQADLCQYSSCLAVGKTSGMHWHSLRLRHAWAPIAALLQQPWVGGEMEKGPRLIQLWLATPCIVEINLAQGLKLILPCLVCYIINLPGKVAAGAANTESGTPSMVRPGQVEASAVCPYDVQQGRLAVGHSTAHVAPWLHESQQWKLQRPCCLLKTNHLSVPLQILCGWCVVYTLHAKKSGQYL